MFLDINGNTFSTLGNTNKVPAFDLNPRQIYGNDLFLWVDFSDSRSLFTDTGLTTNVTTYGDYIRGIRDKSQNNTSLRLANTVSGSTNWQYTSLTQFNNRGGAFRTQAQATTYNGGFVHSVNCFPSNTNYSIHFAFRPFTGATQNNPGIIHFGTGAFNGNISYVNTGSIRLAASSTNNLNDLFTISNTLNDYYICSASFNFTTEIINERYINNIYLSSFSSTTGLQYIGGVQLELLSKRGSSPLFSSLAQFGYVQEIFIATGTPTTQQLEFTHQYLRLKYL